MTTKFLQADLWGKITALAKSAKHKYVAVAYLGKSAIKLLPLNQGDVLVVDLRMETVRAGQVNPFEVEEYLKRGVEVFSYANLHAKVFVFDVKAIIGSANVSSHSKNSLVESAVLVTDSTVVNAARGFVMSLIGTPVTPAYVKSLKKEYHPPRIKSIKRGLIPLQKA
jgi:phosphatidylserine/phosphatidylglycerophosphate/cardiolipin synthase-like enzyme